MKIHVSFLFLSGISVALMFLPACAAAGPPITGSPSGIEGTVTVGPIRPGPVRKGSAPNERPHEATIRIVALNGEKKEKSLPSVRSDASGRFRIELPSGHYRLEPENGPAAGLPFARPIEVAVEKGKMTRVEIRYDSGMR